MKEIVIPNQNVLREIYESRSGARVLIVKDLMARIEQVVSSLPSRPAIKGRTKNFKSFYKKYIRLLKNNPADSAPPLITDYMGIRIVCPFIEDISVVENILKRTFDVTEVERKGHYNFREFGYESTHLLIKIPDDITAKRGRVDCDMVEIQVRTILQDAWAEVEHELVYKAEFNPFDTPMKRKLAAVNASLSLADIIFQEIRTYQRQLNGELGKRRESFFQKIEESNDSFLFSDESPVGIAAVFPSIGELSDERDASLQSGSIDDLLLLALSAHNRNRFDDAITLYSRILELKPSDTISSLIYKHRGMANFAQSQYQDAIEDFTRALNLDSKSYKAAYYRGVVKSVLKQYSEAIDDFTLSLAINPYQSFCLFRRGQAFYHIGDYPQALADCEASLDMEPENEAAGKFKALLQNKLKM
ncbi:MAG: tetratricopeptide repeat protein [Treponema sp.]|jgi:putative GTP pyrophosphokinase|nr:tetratricopeptide repeat protein [Treponema sp.]